MWMILVTCADNLGMIVVVKFEWRLILKMKILLASYYKVVQI